MAHNDACLQIEEAGCASQAQAFPNFELLHCFHQTVKWKAVIFRVGVSSLPSLEVTHLTCHDLRELEGEVALASSQPLLPVVLYMQASVS
eukprot:1148910-Pelagomonas_calceolata.AAC.1